MYTRVRWRLHSVFSIDFNQFRWHAEFNADENEALRDRLTTRILNFKWDVSMLMERDHFQRLKPNVLLSNTNLDIFDEIERPCIDSNATTTFKPQKGSKDIVKTVHLTSVVQPYSYEALRIFLCRKKTKIRLYQQFLLSVSDFYVHSWQYHEREELLNKLIIFVFLHKK